MPSEDLQPLRIDQPDGATHNKEYTDFDGSAATAKYGYVSGKRLQGLSGDDSTIYGKVKAGVVVRPDARWVASEWLLKSNSFLALAKQAIGTGLEGSIDAAGVLIDDAELLGTARELRVVADKLKWEAGITGAVIADVLGSTVALRPDTMTRDGAIIKFEEAGESELDVGVAGDEAAATATATEEEEAEVLSVKWSYREREVALQPRQTLLSAPAALVMDELADGAWETGQPLWVRTGDGFLRWHSGAFNLSYSFSSESRVVDVTAWVPAGPAGSFARLLLDRSGKKTLSIDTASKVATLTIRAPAILVAVPFACCDGRQLAAGNLPPDDASVTGTLCVVTDALCGIESGAAGRLRVEQPAGLDSATMSIALAHRNGLSRYFAPFEQWVRPEESAANSVHGISRARVLLPHKPASDFRLLWGSGLRASNIGAVDYEEATTFESRDRTGRIVTASGYLARFAVGADGKGEICQEFWLPDGEESSGSEPAVLRSIYRRSTASGAEATAVLPSYRSTRVGKDVPTPPTTRELVLDRRALWQSYRPGPGKAVLKGQRLLHGLDRGHRGWLDGVSFLGRPAAAAGPVDYLQLQGSADHVRSWIRLSNDALIPQAGLAAEAGLPETASAGFHAVVTGRLNALITVLGGKVPGEQAGSLALFTLVETLSATGKPSQFALSLKGKDGAVEVWSGPPEDRTVVNRLVIARANPHADQVTVAVNDDCGLVLKKLNRVYLELERDGSQFVVRRAMLGWTAHQAFGLNAVDRGLEVTELFEPVQGKLTRVVEFNGSLAVTKGALAYGSNQYSMKAYFWAATWSRVDGGPSSIRVMCNHSWELIGPPSRTFTFTSVQDARCVNRKLDLSADILVLRGPSGPSPTERVADSQWEPNRRNLFTAVLDATRETMGRTSNEFVAFVKIRHGTAGLKFSEPAPADVFMIPDWRASERDIVPLFSDVPRPARVSRHTWLRPVPRAPYRLGTSDGADPATTEISVVFSQGPADLTVVGTLAACTLVRELDQQPGIPRWIPSPVQLVRTPLADAEAVARVPMRRLWLFDGPPRMVAEWPDQADASKDEKDAKLSLTRFGWTREAVLERDPSGKADEVEWKAIDSPLLNREASVGWFGWPLASLDDHGSGTVWPYDALPRTEAIAQVLKGAPQAFALEVAFDHDFDRKSDGPVRRIHQVDLSEPSSDTMKTAVQFCSAGLRAGAGHRVVDYCGTVVTHTEQAATPLPAPRYEKLMKVDLASLVWEHSTTALDRLTEGEADDLGRRTFKVSLPDNCTGVRLLEFDVGLRVRDEPNAWQDADASLVYIPVQEGPKRSIRICAGTEQPFRVLRLEILTDGKVSGQEHLFPAGTERLVGVFSSEGNLQAFGTEEITYFPGEPSGGASVNWSRSAEWRPGSGSRVASDWYVVAIDIEGRLSVYD